MKVLVVTQYFWPENFRINDLCEGLIEKGHEVTVYTGMPNYPEGELFKGYSSKGPYREKKGSIEIIRSPLITRGKKKSIKLALNFLSFSVFATLLAPFVVMGKFDKIFIYAPTPITVAIPGLFLKYIKKAPVFLWVADLWPESLEATGVVRNKKILTIVAGMVRLLYKFSNKILVTSKGFTPRVKLLGGKDNQIVYFPQWAEDLFVSSFDQDFIDERVPKHGFKVMFAGNVGTSQDFETIVNAAALLKEHKDIFFIILGSGLKKNWAENEIIKMGLQVNFIFLGNKSIEQMPSYYSMADIMLLTLTNTDLFSITVPAKLQSYLASGKPVLASVNGEAANIVTECGAGISVPASSPDQMSKAILDFKNMSKEEISQLGKNARNCYEMNFKRSVLLERIELIMLAEKY
jgi:colanic acid biosynthesis glycosyl transferase WcaI